jgi:hypothetical protein
MIKRNSRAAAVLVGAAGLVLLGSSTAYAFWTTSGSGTATGTAGTSSSLVVTGTANVTGLYPTATNVSGGSVSVRNDNPFKVSVSGASFGAVTVDTAHSACNASSVSFTPGTLPSSSINGNGGTTTITFTASMTNAAVDACQGATFTATLTVNGQSAV